MYSAARGSTDYTAKQRMLCVPLFFLPKDEKEGKRKSFTITACNWSPLRVYNSTCSSQLAVQIATFSSPSQPYLIVRGQCEEKLIKKYKYVRTMSFISTILLFLTQKVLALPRTVVQCMLIHTPYVNSSWNQWHRNAESFYAHE